MNVKELVATLTIPIEVEFRGSEAEYLGTWPSNDCEDMHDRTVLTWWPESREKIVVCVDSVIFNDVC